MRKKWLLALPLVAILFCLFSFSPERSFALRSKVVGAIFPTWLSLAQLREKLSSKAGSEEEKCLALEVERLRQENALLYQSLSELKIASSLRPDCTATAAVVIYREAKSWGSSLWLNVGERENKAHGKRIIAKNSPVVFGGNLIGVVEDVAEMRCRVRLITDANMKPSVCALRGASLLPLRGEIFGKSAPLWRSGGSLLQGVGYCCPETGHTLEPGDLLITSGLDGIFPPNLKVGIVKEVRLQQAGSSTYDFDVEISAGSLDELTVLFILPSNDNSESNNRLQQQKKGV